MVSYFILSEINIINLADESLKITTKQIFLFPHLLSGERSFIIEIVINGFKVVLFFADVDLNGTVIYKDGVAIAEREGCDRLLASIGKTNKWFLMTDSPLRGISKEDNDFYESLFIKALQQAPIPSNSKLKKICWNGISSSDLAAIKKQWNQIKEQ